MKRRSRPVLSLRRGILLSVAGLAVMAAPAVGIDAPPSASVTPPSPTDATSVTLSWAPSTADPGSTITGYAIDAVTDPNAPPNNPVPVDAATTSAVIATPTVGLYYLRVQAVQDIGPASPYSIVSVIVDRQAPTISTSFVGTPVPGAGSVSWFKGPLTIDVTCADDNALPGGACPTAITANTDGKSQIVTTPPVTDIAGKQATATTPAFNLDGTPPTKPAPTSTGALVPDQPTLSWLPSSDAFSGVDHYDVQWQEDETFTSNGWKTLDTVPHAGGPGEFKSKPADWADGPLPINTLLRWRVVAVDAVGNRIASSATGLELTIDPTVPPAPEITGGPSAPTRDNSPTFSWQGDGAKFRWSLTLAGSATPIRGDVGTATSATLPNLDDGTYVLHVTQFTAAQRESAEATRAFTIDTTPPAAPTILTRPTFPAIAAAPTFTWDSEPGAYSRWTILDSAGNLVVGPIDSPVNTAQLPPLAEGPYTFQVLQIDAAGNVSAVTSEGFTVLAPLAPAPAPTSGRTALLAALPKQNALRLRPKAGTILPTLRPVLRWKRGPRGTKLYNLQIFKVTQKKAGAKPKVTKVLSQFPRGLQYRPPKKHLEAGTCYVWRVWPYTGTAFTSRPVGVSNFCVAGKSVLRKKALRVAALRRARHR